jgi:hypothetical protein
MSAVYEEDVARVEHLLDEGADINRQEDVYRNGEKTPLSMAFAISNFEIANLLISRGADVNQPFYSAILQRKISPLLYAMNLYTSPDASPHRIALVRNTLILLLQHGASIHTDIFNKLIEMLMEDLSKDTRSQIAVLDMLRLFLEYGNLNVALKSHGRTILGLLTEKLADGGATRSTHYVPDNLKEKSMRLLGETTILILERIIRKECFDSRHAFVSLLEGTRSRDTSQPPTHIEHYLFGPLSRFDISQMCGAIDWTKYLNDGQPYEQFYDAVHPILPRHLRSAVPQDSRGGKRRRSTFSKKSTFKKSTFKKGGAKVRLNLFQRLSGAKSTRKKRKCKC